MSTAEQKLENWKKRYRENPEFAQRVKDNAAKWVSDNPDRAKAYQDQYYQDNKEKLKEKQRRGRQQDPMRFRGYELKKRFKMTLLEFDALLFSQNGCCAICGSADPGGRYGVWQVDHDHKCCRGRQTCGKCTRGLLCSACNLTLGNADESIERLEKAAEYLRRYVEKDVN